eukprot:UN32000
MIPITQQMILYQLNLLEQRKLALLEEEKTRKKKDSRSSNSPPDWSYGLNGPLPGWAGQRGRGGRGGGLGYPPNEEWYSKMVELMQNMSLWQQYNNPMNGGAPLTGYQTSYQYQK